MSAHGFPWYFALLLEPAVWGALAVLIVVIVAWLARRKGK